MARDTMEGAEKAKAISSEQFGSRKRHQANYLGCIKNMVVDIIRQKRLPAILCSNDAKSCYDRVVPQVLMMSLRRLGVPKSVIYSLIDTFQAMQHHLRTSYGDSDEYFTCEKGNIRFHGTGQGNGFAPCIWAAISTVMIEVMKDLNLGSTIQSAITKMLSTFIAFAFVDDTDLIKIGTNDDSMDQVAEEMQQMLRMWQGLLRSTGGALVPRKSWYVPIDFTWKNGKWDYKKITDIELYMEDHNRQEEKLTLLNFDESKRMLGIYVAADGNSKRQVEVLREKAESWKLRVLAGYLNRANT